MTARNVCNDRFAMLATPGSTTAASMLTARKTARLAACPGQNILHLFFHPGVLATLESLCFFGRSKKSCPLIHPPSLWL